MSRKYIYVYIKEKRKYKKYLNQFDANISFFRKLFKISCKNFLFDYSMRKELFFL